ncbi:hypothetical protein EDB87DRAFT_1634373 [Lactarius vividus]|nr:hypothetical protein EDB87DRAFT_1634373 [Lactarius vividus]
MIIMGRSELVVSETVPTPSAVTADNDLRIVSVTIAAYDYLVTLPAEYRFYRSSNCRSSGLVLFVLIRYTSIIVLVISNVGFFYHGFTPNTCAHFHLVVPALKGTGSVDYASSVLPANRSDSGPNNGVASNLGYSGVQHFPTQALGRPDPFVGVYYGHWISMVFKSIFPDA